MHYAGHCQTLKVILLLVLCAFVLAPVIAQGYQVCIASYTVTGNAKTLADQLLNYGIATTFQAIEVDETVFVRVLLARIFATRAEAEIALAQLRRQPVLVYHRLTTPWIMAPGESTAATVSQAEATRARVTSAPAPAALSPPPSAAPPSTSAQTAPAQTAPTAVAATPDRTTPPVTTPAPPEATQNPLPVTETVIAPVAELVAEPVAEAPAEPITESVAANLPTSPSPAEATPPPDDTPPTVESISAVTPASDLTLNANLELASPTAPGAAEPPKVLSIDQPATSTTTATEAAPLEEARLIEAETSTPQLTAPSDQTPTETTASAEPLAPDPATDAEPLASVPAAAEPLGSVPATETAAEPLGSVPATETATEPLGSVPATETAAEPLASVPATETAAEPPSPDPATETTAEPLGSVPATDTAAEPLGSVPATDTATEPLGSIPATETAAEPLGSDPAPTSDTVWGVMIFASSPIPLRHEQAVTLQTEFSVPDPVYARAYFPVALGALVAGELWHELWINGELVKRYFYETLPEADWTQVQIWLSSEVYQAEFAALTAGQHQVEIRLYKLGPVDQAAGDGAVRPAIAVSRGEFSYLVP